MRLLDSPLFIPPKLSPFDGGHGGSETPSPMQLLNLKLLAKGLTYKQIAEERKVAFDTVKNQILAVNKTWGTSLAAILWCLDKGHLDASTIIPSDPADPKKNLIGQVLIHCLRPASKY